MIDLRALSRDINNLNSEIRQKHNYIIADIYSFLNNPNDNTKIIIDEWKKEFEYIYGDIQTNLSSNNKFDITKMLLNYTICSNDEDKYDKILLLFFSIQTFYSLFIKTIMSKILKDEKMEKNSPTEIIFGTFALQYGINNYCNPDLYCWPVFELDNGFIKIMNEISNCLNQYIIDMPVDKFAENNNFDFIKQIYEGIIPCEFRHSLGEYYTPDWLAEETLNSTLELGIDVKGSTFMDPTCGSGTFIFKTIVEKKKGGCTIDNIVKTVLGIDINPLAVLTAKTNYILSLIDLLDKNYKFEVPIYNCDVLNFENNAHTQNYFDCFNIDNYINAIMKYKLIDSEKIKKIDKVDVLIGNPPWVNWEYLSEKYRMDNQHLWIDYDLFNQKGKNLSFSKEDISVLITYVVIDKFLKNSGILAFVIRQGVFKSSQNGVGFRKFKIRKSDYLKVIRVEDLSNIRAFDNASNSTAIIFIQKGEVTLYPVDYILWKRASNLNKLNFNSYSNLEDVKKQIEFLNLVAMPSDDADNTSVWITAKNADLENLKKVLGTNDYKARTGVFTGGANAVYWLNIISENEDEVLITNITCRAKRKVDKVVKTIEKEHIYPLIKGSNVKKWKVSYDSYILCPHTSKTKMWPIPEKQLKNDSPKTYEYLKLFESDLNDRKGFAGWEKNIQSEEFHAILRIGDYTFSKYKVIWRYIATEFITAVISNVDDQFLGNKTLIPNEKIMYISTDNEQEAYYLCGLLSSSLISNCIKGYMNPTSISTHILEKLNIPNFDPNNDVHISISNLCKSGHEKDNIEPYIQKIDELLKFIY